MPLLFVLRSKKGSEENIYVICRSGESKNGRLLKGFTSDELHYCCEEWKARIQWMISRQGKYVEGEETVFTINHSFSNQFYYLIDSHTSYLSD